MIITSPADRIVYKPQTKEKIPLRSGADQIVLIHAANSLLISENDMLHLVDTRAMVIARTFYFESPIRSMVVSNGRAFVLTAKRVMRIDMADV